MRTYTRKVQLRQKHIDAAINTGTGAMVRISQSCPIFRALQAEFHDVFDCGTETANRVNGPSLFLDKKARSVTSLLFHEWSAVKPMTFTVTYSK